MKAAAILLSVALTAAAAGGCAPVLRSTAPAEPGRVQLEELWQAPADLAARDLFFGPGGRELAPDRDGVYTFVAHKTSGTNPGYDVRDLNGRLWSVKLGVEARAEVLVSRILWAVGFHQPGTYYLERWTLSGQDAGPQPQGRFRIEPEETPVVGDWSWYENPFIGTQPFRGLIVAQLIFNNWDLKTSNNKIYLAPDRETGARRSYVVRDLGASLGVAKHFSLYKWLRIRDKQGTKDDLTGFEEQGFIERVAGDRIDFAYEGIDAPLVGSVGLADVRWMCGLLSKITDGQWHDAFRAAGYTVEERDRYVRKIKSKIAQGLQISSSALQWPRLLPRS